MIEILEREKKYKPGKSRSEGQTANQQEHSVPVKSNEMPVDQSNNFNTNQIDQDRKHPNHNKCTLCASSPLVPEGQRRCSNSRLRGGKHR